MLVDNRQIVFDDTCFDAAVFQQRHGRIQDRPSGGDDGMLFENFLLLRMNRINIHGGCGRN